jgi:hypothetical protein
MVFTSTTNVLRTQWCLQVLRMYLELNGVYKYYECTWNSMVFTSTTHVPRTQWYLQVLRMYLELNGVYKYYECI